ncbi:MAG: DUF350 domain-containing protein [Bacteroidota bacterium]
MEALHLQYIGTAVVYSILGILILLFAFWIIEVITPENIRKEIFEKQNKALAIIAAAFILAIGIIISSAIRG